MERSPSEVPDRRSPAGLGFLLPALVLLALVVGLGAAHARRRWRTAPRPAATGWVDPAGARRVAAPPWADPRWLERVDGILARHAPFAVADAAQALEELRAELAALSFIERVAALEATDEAGLAVELVLRKPIACIPVRGEFALVDEDGVVLEGRWPLPPRLGRGWLPVLGPLDDPLFDRARAGDWLVEPEHTDALDVALSLGEHLGQDQRAGLGRILIDARTARRTSLEEPGVRLELEGGRLALFGRAPRTAEPGELAAGSKWQGLARAFAWFAEDPEAHDWALLDLRWDRPDLAPRAAPALARLEPAAEGALAGPAHRGAAGGRARVR